MAKHKKVKAKKGASKGRAKGQSKSALSFPLAMSILLVFGGILMASTVLLAIGMLPSLVAFFVDRSKSKSQALTVAAMNLAGCSLFLLELWTNGHTMNVTLQILSNPVNIVVMYLAAGAGYLIDWTLSGVIGGLVYQNGKSRLKSIRKDQDELVKRWGNQVKGRTSSERSMF